MTTGIPVTRKALVEDRRRRIAELLLRKVSIADIADQLGVKTATVYKDAERLRLSWRRETLASITDMVAAELAALAADENALRSRWAHEIECSRWLAVYDRIIGVMKRRSEMLGLDQPKELRLDPAMFVEFSGQVMLAIARCVADVALRRKIGEEIERLAGRYIETMPSQPNSNDLTTGAG